MTKRNIKSENFIGDVFPLSNRTVKFTNSHVEIREVDHYVICEFIVPNEHITLYSRDLKKYYSDEEMEIPYCGKVDLSLHEINKVVYSDGTILDNFREISRNKVTIKPVLFEYLAEDDYDFYTKSTPSAEEIIRYLSMKAENPECISYEEINQLLNVKSKFREKWIQKYEENIGRVYDLEKELGIAYQIDLLPGPDFIKIGIEFTERVHGKIKDIVRNNRKSIHNLLFIYYDSYCKRHKNHSLLPFEYYEYHNIMTNNSQLWIILGVKKAMMECLEHDDVNDSENKHI